MRPIILGMLDSLHLGLVGSNLYHRVKYYADVKTLFRNARYRIHGAPDGLPLPPARLIYLSVGGWDAEGFYQAGVLDASNIRRLLEENGLAIEKFPEILDFGCGCGRIIRQWKGLLRTKVHGTDYNYAAIEWCRRALPFADFRTNSTAPSLAYDDNKFDFVYARSVFTHLTEQLQKPWMDELRRIVKPGGFLLFTVHGASRFDKQLTPGEQEHFTRGQLVVKYPRYGSSNFCGAFHPESYVRKHLAKGFTVVDYIPEGGAWAQDWYLLQKLG